MRRKGGKKGNKETEIVRAGMKRKQDSHMNINQKADKIYHDHVKQQGILA